MFEKSDAILRDIRSKREKSKILFSEAVVLKQVYIRELVREAQHFKKNWISMHIGGNTHFFHCISVRTFPIVSWVDLDVRSRDWNVHTDFVEIGYDKAGCIIDGDVSYNVYNKVIHQRYSPEEIRAAHLVTDSELPVLDRIRSSIPFCAD